MKTCGKDWYNYGDVDDKIMLDSKLSPTSVYNMNVTNWYRLISFSATITGIDAEVLAGEVRKRRGTVFMHEKGEVSFFLEASF